MVLWPIAMAAYCFCVSWWWAAEKCTDATLKKSLVGAFVPIPIGARIPCLPRVTEDRKKTEQCDKEFRKFARRQQFCPPPEKIVTAVRDLAAVRESCLKKKCGS